MFSVVVVGGAETDSISKATSVAVGMAGWEIVVFPLLFATSDLSLVIPDRSRHDANMTSIFLHRR